MTNYNSITAFEKYISESTSEIGMLTPAFFYTFHYDYKSNPDLMKIPKHVLDMYDGRPVTFIFNSKVTKSGKIMYEGINFHFMPVRARMIWLNALTKIASNNIKTESRITIPSHMLKSLIHKSKYAYRQYDINRIKYLRKIDFVNVKEMLKFTPPTYDGKSYEEVALNYRLYNPYTVIIKGKR